MAFLNTKITGKTIVVGDNIDTDQIYPGRFLAITDPGEIDQKRLFLNGNAPIIIRHPGYQQCLFQL